MNYNFPSVVVSPHTSMPTSSAVGYRFNPTNEELIINYLVPKMMGDVSHDVPIFPDVHVCKHEPWDLAEKCSNLNSDDEVWYFFGPRDFKYLKNRRSNRKTKAGYWKPTGKKIEVKAKRTKNIIGIKKTLVFYETATPKDKRTGWIIDEYEIINDSINSNQAEYVLCKLKKKLDYKTKRGEANHLLASVSVESSCGMASDFENQNQSKATASSACLNSESSHLVASDFENQNSDEVMTDLSHKASNLSTDSYLENQNSSKLASDLAHDQSGSAMSSYGETQRSNDLIASSGSAKGSEESCHMTSDLEYHNSINMIPRSPYENWIAASDFEDQVSPFQLEGEYGPSMDIPSNSINMIPTSPYENWIAAFDFEDQVSAIPLEGEYGTSMDIPSNLMNHSTCGKGESGSPTASDFEKQNLEKETEISGPNGDERSYLPSNTSNLVIQIPREKTGMSIFEQVSSNNSVASNPENYSTEPMFPEFPQLTPEQIAKLGEILEEFQNCLSSPLQPSAAWSTKETPSYMGFGASVST